MLGATEGINYSGTSPKKHPTYYFVIGIDFGTTFTAVSYARSDIDLTHEKLRPGDIHSIKKWHSSARNSNEVKTELFYIDSTPKTYGEKKPSKAIQRAAKKSGHTLTDINRFKLYLNETHTIQLPELPPGLEPTDVIRDFLSHINAYTIAQMEESLGSGVVRREELRYCLTVPAVWSEKAKNMMRRAAVLAGLVQESDENHKLILVSEPEAAALYCSRFSGGHRLEDGDRFLICDAGGGTVDLVAYQFRDDNRERYLVEVVEGAGDVCGSVCIDDGFHDLFCAFVSDLGIELDHSQIKETVDYFSVNIKAHVLHPDDKDFDDEDFHTIDLKFLADLPEMDENEEMYISDECLYISPIYLIQKVFEPVVKKVLGLIESQIEKAGNKIDYIFLVGGFGQSKYLFRTIKQRYDFVIVPDYGELAITCGAVLMGLAPIYVKKRIIRRTYGIEASKTFDPKIDPESLLNTSKGKMLCEKRFHLLYKKGTEQKIDEYSSEELSYIFERKYVEISLYAYDGDLNNIPRYVTDERVKKIITFRIEIPQVNKKPKEKIKLKVKFFLFQTEIKIEVDIENNVKIYSGLEPRSGQSEDTAFYNNDSPKSTNSLSNSQDTSSPHIYYRDYDIQSYEDNYDYS